MTSHPDKFRKEGERNFIRVGDLVKCSPPGKERSFVGRVVRLDAEDGKVTAVNVAVVCTLGGLKHNHVGKARAFTPDCISRTRVTPKEEAS